MDLRLPPDFKEFLKLLKEHDVQYLLIGGYAVSYHGYPRATDDLDIWIAIHPDNARKLVSVFNAFGLEDPNLTPELFMQKPKIIRMGFPPMRLEIATSISGVEFDECYQARIVDQLDGVEVNLIDLKNLKKNKQASGRAKDIADLENLYEGCRAGDIMPRWSAGMMQGVAGRVRIEMHMRFPTHSPAPTPILP